MRPSHLLFADCTSHYPPWAAMHGVVYNFLIVNLKAWNSPLFFSTCNYKMVVDSAFSPSDKKSGNAWLISMYATQ